MMQKSREQKQCITVEEAAEKGIELIYFNTAKAKDAEAELMAITDGKGYDDIFVYVPIKPVAEMGDRLLAFDGCMNFFCRTYRQPVQGRD